jgi:hypothetical protein
MTDFDMVNDLEKHILNVKWPSGLDVVPDVLASSRLATSLAAAGYTRQFSDETLQGTPVGTRLWRMDDGYVVADGGGWIDGLFPTAEEAIAAAHAEAELADEATSIVDMRKALARLLYDAEEGMEDGRQTAIAHDRLSAALTELAAYRAQAAELPGAVPS